MEREQCTAWLAKSSGVDETSLKCRFFDERLFSQGMAWQRRALRIAPDGLYCSKASQEIYFAYVVILCGLLNISGLQDAALALPVSAETTG